MIMLEEAVRSVTASASEKWEVLLGGVDTPRYYFFPPNAHVQWQPGDLTIHTNKVVPRSRVLRSTSHFSYSV